MDGMEASQDLGGWDDEDPGDAMDSYLVQDRQDGLAQDGAMDCHGGVVSTSEAPYADEDENEFDAEFDEVLWPGQTADDWKLCRRIMPAERFACLLPMHNGSRQLTAEASSRLDLLVTAHHGDLLSQFVLAEFFRKQSSVFAVNYKMTIGVSTLTSYFSHMSTHAKKEAGMLYGLLMNCMGATADAAKAFMACCTPKLTSIGFFLLENRTALQQMARSSTEPADMSFSVYLDAMLEPDRAKRLEGLVSAIELNDRVFCDAPFQVFKLLCDDPSLSKDGRSEKIRYLKQAAMEGHHDAMTLWVETTGAWAEPLVYMEMWNHPEVHIAKGDRCHLREGKSLGVAAAPGAMQAYSRADVFIRHYGMAKLTTTPDEYTEVMLVAKLMMQAELRMMASYLTST